MASTRTSDLPDLGRNLLIDHNKCVYIKVNSKLRNHHSLGNLDNVWGTLEES